jgi:predicted GIY-YIG superfamily endonuclease
MEQTGIYWIRHKNHTNLMCEGYIGVTKNLKERLRHHFKNAKGGYHSDKVLSKAIVKYGKENIESSLIIISDELYCYDLEKKLRPKAFVGWNMREGGYHTPNPFPKGSKMPSSLVDKVQKTIAEKRANGQCGNDKAVEINGQKFNRIKDAREAFGISKTQMTRILRGVTYNSEIKGNTKFAHLEIKYASK